MLKNKVALITGSSSGIGKRIAIDLAKNGFHCLINYNTSKQEAETLCDVIRESYKVKAIAIQGDVSEPEQCEGLVNEALKYFDKIDVLVNNAGPYVHERKTTVDYSISEWNYIINGNLNSVFYLVKDIVPKMRQQQWGRIINIGFDRADTAAGWIYRGAFAAAKVGLVSLTKSLAIEEASNGITVNMVCPGEITSEMKEAEIRTSRKNFDPDTPIGRSGTGEDISRIISFLCEENSDLITGSIITATGSKDVLSKARD